MRSRRSSSALVAGCAVALTVVALGSVPVAEASPAGVSPSPGEAAAAQLAQDWHVSLSEAVQRVDRQRNVEDFVAAVESGNPSTFGGAYVDQANGGRVVVLSTSPIDLAALAEQYGLTGLVSQKVTGYTATGLQQVATSIGGRAAPQVAALGNVTTYVDQVQDRVVVKLPPTSPDPAARSSFIASLAPFGDEVHVASDGVPMRAAALCDQWTCPPPLRGGVESDWTSDGGGGYLCTLAFIGKDNLDNAEIALSAGHCHTVSGPYISPGPNDTYDLGPTIGDMVRYQNGGNVDAEVIDLTTGGGMYSPDSTNYVYQRNQPLYTSDSPTGDETFQITSVASNSNIVTGVYVCKSARTSGFTCGQIDQTSVSSSVQDETGGTTNYTNFFGFTGCSAGGDSGGPVYDSGAGRAYGIVSFVPSSQYSGCGLSTSGETYSPSIANVVSSLGVTINTVDGSQLF